MRKQDYSSSFPRMQEGKKSPCLVIRALLFPPIPISKRLSFRKKKKRRRWGTQIWTEGVGIFRNTLRASIFRKRGVKTTRPWKRNRELETFPTFFYKQTCFFFFPQFWRNSFTPNFCRAPLCKKPLFSPRQGGKVKKKYLPNGFSCSLFSCQENN